MKKILQFIKKFFYKIKATINGEKTITKSQNQSEIKTVISEEIITIKNINWDLINSLSKYDIVQVKMNDEEIQKKQIEESHQHRPFIIMEKKDEKELALGYYLTSNMQNPIFKFNGKFNGMKVILNKDIYKLKKHSLILFQEEIKLPYENIQKKVTHINNHDLNKLKKYRNILYQITTNSTKENKIIEIGDIISCNNINYVIYQMDNSNCYGYQIEQLDDNMKTVEKYNCISFYGNLYFIDYEKNKIFNNNDTLYIIARFNNETIERIKMNKKKIKQKQKQKIKQKFM